MKITITVTATFAAAHRLPDHEGKCFRLHGHTYGLEVSVEGTPQETGPAAGMVMDFADLRARVNELVVERLDHQLLNDLFDFVPDLGSGGGLGFRDAADGRSAGGAASPGRGAQLVRGSDALARPAGSRRARERPRGREGGPHD